MPLARKFHCGIVLDSDAHMLRSERGRLLTAINQDDALGLKQATRAPCRADRAPRGANVAFTRVMGCRTTVFHFVGSALRMSLK